jgi:hypothetical protein
MSEKNDRDLTFSTNDLNLSAALSAATRQSPTLIATSPGLARFKFARTPELVQAIMAFQQDSLMLEARNLLSVRNRLYARLREVRNG